MKSPFFGIHVLTDGLGRTSRICLSLWGLKFILLWFLFYLGFPGRLLVLCTIYVCLLIRISNDYTASNVLKFSPLWKLLTYCKNYGKGREVDIIMRDKNMKRTEGVGTKDNIMFKNEEK